MKQLITSIFIFASACRAVNYISANCLSDIPNKQSLRLSRGKKRPG